MISLKNTQRSVVSMSFDGRVTKSYLGPQAQERFENEIRVLEYLNQRRCPFVPGLLDFDREQLQVWMTSCGIPVLQLSDERCQALFDELEDYGVLHEDRHRRNVTYRPRDGRFCLIDFEYAQIIQGLDVLAIKTENAMEIEIDRVIDLIEDELK